MRKANPKDIPEDKTIEVLNLPDMKNYLKVKNFDQLMKLQGEGVFINKFNKQKKTIYFIEPYYYEEKR